VNATNCPAVPAGFCGYAQCDATTQTCSNIATCSAPAGDNCNNYNCVNGICQKSLKAVPNNDCDTVVCQGGNIAHVPVSCPAATACTTYSCVVGQGCKAAPIGDPNPGAANACQQRVCQEPGGWTNVNIAGCGSGCTSTCTAPDQCSTAFCSTATSPASCATTPKPACPQPDKCQTPVCNPATGNCDYTPKNCNDNNKCTTDSCDAATGNCINTPVVCAGQSACVAAVCNPTTGNCDLTPKNCDDGVACTEDSCGATGCVHTTVDSVCNAADPCQMGTCTSTGCNYNAVQCPPDSDLCNLPTCVAFSGCSFERPVCNTTKGTCNTGQCNSTNGKCYEVLHECAAFTVAEVVAIGLGVAAIIGIVVAVVVFVAVSGGAGYALYQNFGDSSLTGVSNNPLYVGKGREGQNPLHKAGIDK
jgi:hypothetical protein